MSPRYTPFLLLYAMYTNNYRAAVNTLQRLRKTPSIEKWLNECVVVVVMVVLSVVMMVVMVVVMLVVMMAVIVNGMMVMKLVVAVMVKLLCIG